MGDSTVGKSCLMSQLISNTFPESTMPTIGIDYMPYSFLFEDSDMKSGNGLFHYLFQLLKVFKGYIWDSAGLDHFRPIKMALYK